MPSLRLVVMFDDTISRRSALKGVASSGVVGIFGTASAAAQSDERDDIVKDIKRLVERHGAFEVTGELFHDGNQIRRNTLHSATPPPGIEPTPD